MKKILFLIFFLLTFTTLAFAEQYPVQFQVICENSEIKEKLEKKVSKLIKKNKNITLARKRSREIVVAKLWIYALEHKESKYKKKMWAFSVAHTSHLPIHALVKEVFKKGKKSGENLKKITANIFLSKGGILKHINLSMIDNFEKSNQVMERFVHDFSQKLVTY